MKFLSNSEITPRPLNLNIRNLSPESLFIGNGNQALEVAVFSSNSKPASGLLHQAFKERKSGRAVPVLIVVNHASGTLICGTGGEQPRIFECEDTSQVERLCESALKLPNRNSAINFLSDAMPSLETSLPGISNEGLLSLHELIHGTKNRSDWVSATECAKSILGKSKNDLISGLGFTRQTLDNLTDILMVKGEKTALAVLLNDNEIPEVGNDRFNNMSPVSYALTKADKEKLPWVVMVKGERIRLYNTKNIGVGRRGRTETYIECQSSLMASKDLGLIWMLFSSDALKDGGTINSIIEQSKRFAADVADKLRDRIYDIVIPEIAMGIAKAQKSLNPSKDEIALTYEMALTVLFRLLFIAYAEDRDLLPYKGNELYRTRSLKNKALELAETAKKNVPISLGTDHWNETVRLWQAVSLGNKEWGVPAYGGTMFSSDKNISKAGAAIDMIELPNSSFELALRGLLLTETKDSLFSPVDFRTLSVREFGTIYEGLLESELSLALQDLTRDKKGSYLPATTGDKIFVKSGDIYLHDRSGARKASGSYYTPDFAVEYLLDGSLEKGLDQHLKNLSGLNDADRVDQFFNFRVADIAMGSGHFLVAAIDRIERRFALWLEENPTPGIMREIQYLRESSNNQLGDLASTVTIEDGQLLRRMIARRCIYGVDFNPITVQLARLSVWIHTFVPGLPLSLLDHNLVYGNSLVGVGSLDEIKRKFDESLGTLFAVDADNLLGKAAEPLKKLAKLSDASVKDIEIGRALLEETKLKTLETKALCDLITAQSISEDLQVKGFQFEDWERQSKDIQYSKALPLARNILKPLSPLHFPIAFPEVFLGKTQGFNVILGNPPWQEVTVEEDAFWARYYPGLGGYTQREQEIKKQEFRLNRPDLVSEYENELNESKIMRKFLVNNFKGMEKGDPDLYKAFCNRFINLNGQYSSNLGIVLPRSAFSAAGSENFRKELVQSYSYSQITILKNTKSWVFENVSEQYAFVFLNCYKFNSEVNKIELKGPYFSNIDFQENLQSEGVSFKESDICNWNDTWSFPALPDQYSAEIFKQMRKFPRLDLNHQDEWRVRPDREMDATNQKHLMDLESKECPEGFFPVYKGKSFKLWDPDQNQYYAFASPKVVYPWLQQKRINSHKRNSDSVHKEFTSEYIFNENTLAPNRPRIAFRDISRATDPRTIIACLIPPKCFLTNKAPFLHFPRGDALDEAYLLGVLCSIPLDWYARRFVELNVNYFIFNPLPIPRPVRENKLWQEVVKLSGRLASVDKRYADWSNSVGVSYGSLDEEEKLKKIYKLDAIVAHLYGLSENQLVHIFRTFREGWNGQPRLDGVLKYYHTYENRDK